MSGRLTEGYRVTFTKVNKAQGRYNSGILLYNANLFERPEERIMYLTHIKRALKCIKIYIPLLHNQPLKLFCDKKNKKIKEQLSSIIKNLLYNMIVNQQ